MNKEEYLKELEKYESLLVVQAEALEDIPDLPEWAEMYPISIIEPGNFRIDIPFDRKKLSVLRKLLGKSWQFSRSGGPGESGDIVFNYIHKELAVELKVVLDASHAESVCKLVKVGERISPIYEVRCDAA